MRKSKFRSAVLAAVMSACMLLTACGDKTNSSENSAPASNSQAVSSAVSETASQSVSSVASVAESAVSEASSADSAASDGASADSANSNAPATADAGFKVDGAKLLDAKGNEFIMRGINHAHTWYKDQLETAIPAIAKTGANCVRVVLSNGNVWTKDEKADVEKIIKLCEDNKLVAVLEVHDATFGTNENGKNVQDSIDDLQLCADYWIEMKDVVNAHLDTVIVNIANEWHKGDWCRPEEWADGYKTVIPKLREAGIKNTLMVDCDGCGQYVRCIYGDDDKDKPAYAPEVLAADPDKNTMFSMHMYENAAASEDVVKGHIDGAIGTGVCFIVGEFANTRSAKKDNVADDAVTAYCTEKNIGYIAWSWKGNTPEKISKNEALPFSVMDMTEEWDGSKLTTDWGDKVVNGENGIKKTSKVCTVFE